MLAKPLLLLTFGLSRLTLGRKGPTVQLDRPVPPPGSAGEDRGDRRCSEQAGASPHRRRSWRRSPSDPGSGSSRPTPARPPAGARPWPAPHPEEPEVPLQLQRSGCSAKRKEWIWLGQRLTIQPAYITHAVSTDVTMPLGPSAPDRPPGWSRGFFVALASWGLWSIPITSPRSGTQPTRERSGVSRWLLPRRGLPGPREALQCWRGRVAQGSTLANAGDRSMARRSGPSVSAVGV
jgi:hypothetical protein